jgi:hypothetical protein
MTFGEYLAELRKKNPDMPLSGKMTLSIESFEKALRHAFEAGRDSKPVADKLRDKLFPWM